MALGFHRALRDFIENAIVLWYHLRKEVIDMAENKLADLSTEFAVKILESLKIQKDITRYRIS